MKILNQNISSVYVWAIAVLTLLIITSSYALGQAPYQLIFAVALSAAVDAAVSKFYLNHGARIPISAIITGMVIGSVAPYNASFLLIAAAVLIAVLSKALIKFKGVNMFNPAALGLLIALMLFSVGAEWWASGNYIIAGIPITLAPLLAIAAYKARRLTTALSFVAASFVAMLVINQPANGLSLAGLAAPLLSVNYFFAFIMLSDPKTSPNDRLPQATYGMSVALAYSIFALYGVSYPFLIAILLGNAGYVVYKNEIAFNAPVPILNPDNSA